MQCVELKIIYLLIVSSACDSVLTSNENRDLWESAKRDLAQRTREYIKRNPISEELRSFIEELRQPKRRKRQDHHDMYVVNNGEVVPLAQLEEHFNADSNSGNNFTVVPLIIPIPLLSTLNVKEQYGSTEESDSNEQSSQRAIEGRGSVLKTRKNNKESTSNDEESTQQDVKSSTPKKAKDKDGESKNDKQIKKDKSPATEETIVDSLLEEKLKSTSEAIELSKVLENVQNLINAEKSAKGSSKEGALCNVFGYWDSEAGGMNFHIKKSDNGTDIVMRPTEPPSEDGFIPQDKWNVTARIPFAQSAQVILTLTANRGRRVALFLGECRICDGSETITGDWLVGRTSSNCNDQKAAHSFLSDVFRKNNVEALREAHMKKISAMTTASSSTTEIT